MFPVRNCNHVAGISPAPKALYFGALYCLCSTSALLYPGRAGNFAFMLQRFDIGASFLLLLGLYLIYDQNPGWAGVALALGTGAKLYPAIALPLGLIYLWRYKDDHKAAWRCLSGFCLT